MKTCLLFFCALVLLSCEKNINFTLKEAPNVLVVDASIENGQPPFVVLSNSFDYFSKITPALLAGIFVHDAEVYISTGNTSQQLKEYSIDSVGGNRIYYYSIDSSNLPAAFVGETGATYNLKVISDGEEYDATTTIPFH